MRLVTLAAIFLLLAATSAGCHGRSGGVDTGGNLELLAQQEVQDPGLIRAAALVDRGQGDRAFKQLVQRFKNQPQAAYPEIAIWLAANALIADGNRIKAFYYLDQLMEEHPASPLYQAAARKQYEIADSYLSNLSDRYLIFFPYRRHDEAIEMLFRVQLRVPGSPLAERALKRTGDFYYEQGEFDFAEDAYGVFVDRFPRSPEVPIVRLKQAFSNIEQYHGPAYDPTPLLDADVQLAAFAQRYPEIEPQLVAETRAWVQEQLAEKLMIKSDYYVRTGEPRAARVLLSEVAREYPDTGHAGRAQRRLERRGDVELGPATLPTTQSVLPEAQP